MVIDRVADSERDLNLHGKAWLALGIGPQRDRPALARLANPLSEARLALISTGGFVAPGGGAFNTGKFGDPSFREIPRDIDPGSLLIYHPHYDHDIARRDINSLFPVFLCMDLAKDGLIGSVAEINYSFMGYVPLTRTLERTYAPQVAGLLKQRSVDAVLLTPA
jgi:hypothetical protein